MIKATLTDLILFEHLLSLSLRFAEESLCLLMLISPICESLLLLSNDRLYRSVRYQWQAPTAHQSNKENELDNQRQMGQQTKCKTNNGKTSIPRGHMYFVNYGKVLNDKKTPEESNIEEGATIDM